MAATTDAKATSAAPAAPADGTKAAPADDIKAAPADDTKATSEILTRPLGMISKVKIRP
jgi:hypothetical protein